jgi:hypothetical protein
MLEKIADGSAAHCFGRTVNEERNALGFSQNEAMFIGTDTLPFNLLG